MFLLSFLYALYSFNSALDGQPPSYIYVEQLKMMVDNDSSSLYVDFQHVTKYDHPLSSLIEEEYYRFVRSLNNIKNKKQQKTRTSDADCQ